MDKPLRMDHLHRRVYYYSVGSLSVLDHQEETRNHRNLISVTLFLRNTSQSSTTKLLCRVTSFFPHPNLDTDISNHGLDSRNESARDSGDISRGHDEFSLTIFPDFAVSSCFFSARGV
jgi:hypothetical protein